MSAVTDIKADGNAVVFELADGNADFGFITSDYHFAIMPATGKDSIDWQSGIGTGPYFLYNDYLGVHAKLHRNPNYWKANSA